MESKYRLVDVFEGQMICEFCGKKEISRIFAVEDMDTGAVKNFGSSCIKKALGVKAVNGICENKIIEIKDKYRKMIFDAKQTMNMFEFGTVDHAKYMREYNKLFDLESKEIRAIVKAF